MAIMSIGRKRDHEEITLERLERAQAAIAFAMTLDGPVYAPYFERLEREIATMRAADDVMARARRFLETGEVRQPLQLPPAATSRSSSGGPV